MPMNNAIVRDPEFFYEPSTGKAIGYLNPVTGNPEDGGPLPGSYASLSALEAAKPAASNVGAMALAGGVNYLSNGETWYSVTGGWQASPLKDGFTAVFLGDSIDEVNTSSLSVLPAQRNTWAQGWACWALALIGARPGKIVNLGVGGQTSSQIAARVDAALAEKPDLVFVGAGTNDTDSAAMVRNYISNMIPVYEAFRTAGVFVVARAGTVRNTDSAAKKQRYYEMESWLQEYWGVRPWGAAVAANSVVIDPATGNWRTGMSYDGVHPSNTGAYALGKQAAADIGARVSVASGGLVVGGDDAAGVTAGFIVVNPLLSGTGGTNGAGCSGDVATSWSTLCTGGVTAVHTKEVDGAYGVQVATLTASAAGEYYLLQVSASQPAGAKVRGGAKCTLVTPSGVDLVRGILSAASSLSAGALSDAGTTTAVFAEGFTAHLHTWDDLTTTAAGTVQWAIRLRFKTAGSAVLKVSRPTIAVAV